MALAIFGEGPGKPFTSHVSRVQTRLPKPHSESMVYRCLSRVDTPEFISCSAWGAKLSPLFSTHVLDDAPLVKVCAISARRQAITHLYPNFPVLRPRGTPSFTPVPSRTSFIEGRMCSGATLDDSARLEVREKRGKGGYYCSTSSNSSGLNDCILWFGYSSTDHRHSTRPVFRTL